MIEGAYDKGSTPLKTYPYSINKQDLIKKIKDLTDISNDAKAYLIELVNTKKKYGLEGARRRNETLGRTKGISKETLEKYQYAKHLCDNKKLSIDKACKQAGISKTTFYRVERGNKIKYFIFYLHSIFIIFV